MLKQIKIGQKLVSVDFNESTNQANATVQELPVNNAFTVSFLLSDGSKKSFIGTLKDGKVEIKEKAKKSTTKPWYFQHGFIKGKKAEKVLLAVLDRIRFAYDQHETKVEALRKAVGGDIENPIFIELESVEIDAFNSIVYKEFACMSDFMQGLKTTNELADFAVGTVGL